MRACRPRVALRLPWAMKSNPFGVKRRSFRGVFHRPRKTLDLNVQERSEPFSGPSRRDKAKVASEFIPWRAWSVGHGLGATGWTLLRRNDPVFFRAVPKGQGKGSLGIYSVASGDQRHLIPRACFGGDLRGSESLRAVPKPQGEGSLGMYSAASGDQRHRPDRGVRQWHHRKNQAGNS